MESIIIGFLFLVFRCYRYVCVQMDRFICLSYEYVSRRYKEAFLSSFLVNLIISTTGESMKMTKPANNLTPNMSIQGYRTASKLYETGSFANQRIHNMQIIF